MREEDTAFVRMHASGNGTTIAVRTLLYDNRNGYSPVGIRIRTNGPTTLEIRKDQTLEPYHSLTLPERVPGTDGELSGPVASRAARILPWLGPLWMAGVLVFYLRSLAAFAAGQDVVAGLDVAAAEPRSDRSGPAEPVRQVDPGG